VREGFLAGRRTARRSARFTPHIELAPDVLGGALTTRAGT